MNAYEMADELLRDNTQLTVKAAYMLRQQANRIADLENQLDKCSHHEAMAHQGGYEIGKASQIKKLSDEEILSFTGFKNNPYDIFIEYEKEDLIKFAKEIRKKANEK